MAKRCWRFWQINSVESETLNVNGVDHLWQTAMWFVREKALISEQLSTSTNSAGGTFNVKGSPHSTGNTGKLICRLVEGI